MKPFEDLTEIRSTEVDGETDWVWVKGDSGAFGMAGYGPMRDWIEGHRTKYFTSVKKFDIVVTGGTSCGMYARFYAKMFKHVFAFEPDPLSFHCMVNNCQYDNVVKLNAALGNENLMVGIARPHPENIGMNHIDPSTEKFMIPMMTIDSLNLPGCDLLQLDVERYESRAIEGAITTIMSYKPVIVAEMFHTPAHQEFMKSIGYKLEDISFMDAIYVPN